MGASAPRLHPEFPAAEWSPEILAAYELTHLGFYTASPLEVERHAERLAEEFSVASIAELVDYPDKAPACVCAIITNLSLRTTKKGEKMAWLTLADATVAIEGAVFPNAFQSLVNRAQRPEVCDAAGRLVEAIDTAAEHKKRAPRSSSRRSRTSS